MTQVETLHMRLLEFEHPMTPERDRLRHAEAVCYEARVLLKDDYGFFDDRPEDAKPPQAQPDEPRQPKDQGRLQRILSATGDFLRRNAGRQGRAARR